MLHSSDDVAKPWKLPEPVPPGSSWVTIDQMDGYVAGS